MSLSRDESDWLESLLSAMPQARLAVFGDFCLDAYWLIDPEESELSLETQLPVRRIRRQRYSLGGAGNIVANLAALGVGRVEAVGLIGDDLFGREMLAILQRLNVDCGGILSCQRDFQTMVFGKPCLGEVEQNRIDFGGFNVLAAETADALTDQLDRAAGRSSVVILNQQVPGGVSAPEMIQKINAVVAARPDCKFIADSRHRAWLYRGCSLKLNAHEAAGLLGQPRPLDQRIPAEQAQAFASQLAERTNQAVLITRGEDGLIVADGRQLHEIPAIGVSGPTDPVGAGDTAVATFAAALACGADLLAAARLAALAASVTVRKLQTTGTASPQEIRHAAAKTNLPN